MLHFWNLVLRKQARMFLGWRGSPVGKALALYIVNLGLTLSTICGLLSTVRRSLNIDQGVIIEH